MTPEQMLTEADRCVKCGYCLPHCPTYALSADEGESPRGRIALIQALIQGNVDSERLHRHLDSCLACRACEPVCPSEVRYGQLITAVRAVQAEGGRRAGALHKAGLFLLSGAPYIQPMAGLLAGYRRLGLASLGQRLGGAAARRLHALLPNGIRSHRWNRVYPAAGDPMGRVGLFTGCIGRITDQPALIAGIRVLNRLGYEVVVPPDQRCCGAMHLHSGDAAAAENLARTNRKAFAGQELEAILGVATGCSARLMDYSPQGAPLAAPVMDISSFLCETPGIDKLELRPLDSLVTIHTPCSMRNILRETSAPRRLLQQIPGIELQGLQDNGLCCGAAGLYLLTHPENADRLRRDKIGALQQSRAEILVTSNTGCALHLAAGARAAGMEIEVLHPVELLVRQLAD
jgi:glycolate oxidase iron-sulfur subunit